MKKLFILLTILLLFSGCGDETPTKTDLESRQVVNNAGNIVKVLVADGGSTQFVHPQTVVQLDAAKSSGTGNLEFAWKFLSKPATSNISITESLTMKPRFTPDIEGEYILELKVKDSEGKSTVTTVRIVVENSIPVANAGLNQSLHLGKVVYLDGSGSLDLDGDTLNYSWSMTSKPIGSTAILSSVNTFNPTFFADVNGIYELSLEVSDGYTSSTVSTMTVSVGNIKPIANAGSNQSFSVSGQVIFLDGSQSDDADGDGLTYTWIMQIPSGSNTTLSDTNTTTPYFYADVVGEYKLSLVVNDGYEDSLESNITIGISLTRSWAKISTGLYHTLAIKSDGTLWAWGYNVYGRLGDGTSNNSAIPIQIGSASNWTAISAGDNHSVAVNSDGKLYAWGQNTSGELGNGTTDTRTVPVQENTFATDWSQVSAGLGFTVAIKTDGSMWAWGYNYYGQFGNGKDGANENTNTIAVEGPAGNWTSVTTGSRYTVAIKSDGSMWAWGKGDSGQLGEGLIVNENSPVQENTNAMNWLEVSAGNNHNLALNSLGELYAFGENTYGQIGDSSNGRSLVPKRIGSDKTWASVSAGYDHSLAKTTSGELWAWGRNDYKQLGDETVQGYNYPVQVHTSATNWLSLSSGRYFNTAINENGELWSWGYNNHGNLGNGMKTDILIPTQEETKVSNWIDAGAGYRFSVGLKSDGTLWTWGSNSSSALGDGGNVGKISPNRIASDKTWTRISVGNQHSLAIDNENKLWVWGSNSYAQLGTGGGTTSQLLQINGDTDWGSISAGYYHSAAIKIDGTLWLWGANSYGQLGIDSNVTANIPTKAGIDTDWASVSVWNYYTMAIKTDGTLWACGRNDQGQFGNSSTQNEQQFIKIGTDTDWASVSVGINHTVAIKTDGTLWTWGDDGADKLGNGMGNQASLIPQKVGNATNWTYSRAGTNYTAAINGDGELWAWGANDQGQHGVGNVNFSPTPRRVGSATNWIKVDITDRHTLAINDDNSDGSGELWAWGKNDFSQVTPGITKPTFAQSGE